MSLSGRFTADPGTYTCTYGGQPSAQARVVGVCPDFHPAFRNLHPERVEVCS